MLLPWDIDIHELSFYSLSYGNTYNIHQMLYVLFDVIIRWKITLHNKRTYNFYIATDTHAPTDEKKSTNVDGNNLT